MNSSMSTALAFASSLLKPAGVAAAGSMSACEAAAVLHDLCLVNCCCWRDSQQLLLLLLRRGADRGWEDRQRAMQRTDRTRPVLRAGSWAVCGPRAGNNCITVNSSVQLRDSWTHARTRLKAAPYTYKQYQFAYLMVVAPSFRCVRVLAARVFVVEFAGTWSAAGAEHIADTGGFSA
jgi:hypothetical protein